MTSTVGSAVPPPVVRMRRRRFGGQLVVIGMVGLIVFGMAATVWWRRWTA
jgi:hypothetical protein